MNNFATVIFDRNRINYDRIAIVDQNGQRKITWQKLYEQSCKVAKYVIENKVEGLVPVCMGRGYEMVAAMLGMSLAGIGVAPQYDHIPQNRKEQLEKQTGNKAFEIEDYTKAMKGTFEVFNEVPYKDNVNYVVFTSGSTGEPKGVVISNDCVLKALKRVTEKEYLDLTPEDLVLHTGSFAFISLLINMFSPLYAGATVHIVPDEYQTDAEQLTRYLNENKITKTLMPPQLYRNLGKTETLKIAVVGSDKVSNIETNGRKVRNVYGMSETCSIITSYEIEKAENNTPLGSTHKDCRTYIVDENGKLSNEGEFCVSGAIAEGYYKNEELTKQVFQNNPFSNEKGFEKLLHTGDWVRVREDGNIIHLYRMNSMVKINGQRVETGEVEANINKIDGVEDCAVKGFSKEDGSTYLCAYYVGSKTVEKDEAAEFLKKFMPEYMIPSFFVKMDAFPTTVTGKKDRKALQEPDKHLFRKEYVKPNSVEEKQICSAFEKTLKLEKVGIKDDFFSLGGDSISVIEVVKNLSNYSLTVSDVMVGKTPEKIAKQINGKKINILQNLNNKSDKVKLTDSQRGIYFEMLRNPESIMYNIPIAFTVDRKNKSEKDIKNAVDRVIEKHPALYSKIENSEDEIFMVRNKFSENGICTITDKIEENFVKPFNLFEGPLCRVNATLEKDKIHFLLDTHHIVSDGTSASVLIRQIKNSLEGKEIKAEEIDAFCLYEIENREKTEENITKSKNYFEQLLGGVDVDSKLLVDKKSAKEGAFDCSYISIRIPEEKIKTSLANSGITESSLFASALSYTLCKMTGQEESLFCFAENGRQYSQLSETVSMMVKTLPVYTQLDEEQKSFDFVKKIQNQMFESVDNDIYPFENIVKEFGINTGVMYAFEGELVSGALEVNQSSSDLALKIMKENNIFKVELCFRNDCYTEETAKSFLTMYNLVVDGICENKELSEIKLCTEEQIRTLNTFHGERVEFDRNKTVVDLFEENAKRFSEKTCVVCKDKKYTYRNVKDTADSIANYIVENKIEKNSVVSVLINRNEFMVLASLGVLKSGCVYQPLDPGYPSERLSYMISDSDAKLIIADRDLVEKIPDYKGKILYTDEIEKLKVKETNLANPQDGFVILYTSGTTGQPKGCILKHSNLMALICSYKRDCEYTQSCVSAVFASYGFDAHMADVYPALSNGGEIHIITDDIRFDLNALKEYLEKNKVTHTAITTQVARQFATEFENVESLRYLLTGGEKLVSFEPKSNYTLINAYGPSETTIYVTVFKVDKFYEDIPIGKANCNVNVYVVDKYNRRLPVGVPGELVISGPQVGKEYLNKKEQTEKVFVKNVFDSDSEDYSRSYKSGDIVRFLSDGNIQFIGRRDKQVKIRGFRIELSEVEKVIRDYPGITDATVVAKEENGGKNIYAYIVADEKIDIPSLEKFIKETKPSYMVPAGTMQIEKIPLTVNMKVDKKKLPEFEKKIAEKGEGRANLTYLEKEITKIVSEVTSNGNIGVETTLTDLGVTSVTSMKLAVKLYKKFNVQITAKDILDGGTVLKLEDKITRSLLEKSGSTSDKASGTERKKLSSYPLMQNQIGIYSECLMENTRNYNIPALYRIPKGMDIVKLKEALVKTIKAHKSLLCSIKTDGEGNPGICPLENAQITIDQKKWESLKIQLTEFKFDGSLLFRVELGEFEGENYLFMDFHHIIFDGESMAIFMKDLEDCYNGKEIETESYTAFDLATDESVARNSDAVARAKAYYDSVFRGISLDYLPNTDRSEKSKLGIVKKEIDISVNSVEKICKKANVTENIFFMASYAALIAKYTFHEDAQFTTIYNGRIDPRTANLAGMLVKTLPVYIQLPDDMHTEQLLQNLSEHVGLLKKNDLYSFAEASHDYGLKADTMFIYQGEILSKGIFEMLEGAQEGVKAPIALEVFKNNNTYSVNIEYNAGMYSEEFIKGFANSYEAAVKSLLNISKLSELTILSDTAFEEFKSFNDTGFEVPYKPLYALMQENAEKYPDRLAVIAKDRGLTYKQLNNMANTLAKKLLNSGVEMHSVVEVITYRTTDNYLSQQGILKAGSAFLCLSPEYPDERIKFVTRESEAKALITTHEIYEKRKALFKALSDELKIQIFFSDDIGTDAEEDNLNLNVEASDTAYIIYTSGSTGKPKGVMLSNRGLVNYMFKGEKNPSIGDYSDNVDVFAGVSTFTFDASLWDEYVSLSTGKTIVLATEDEVHDVALFTQMCIKNKVQAFSCTPSFILNLLDYKPFLDYSVNLVSVVVAGEAFVPSIYDILKQQNSDIKILNLYGPTEASIGCTEKLLTSSKNITIGRPIVNSQIYMIDRQHHILPKGALGEMTVIGDCVGKGYINRPEQTQSVFITLLNKPAYRTGDLSLINYSDEIEFHGRIDNQVKLRGLRVELGEIENAIESYPGVKKSVITVNGDESNRYLAGFYTSEEKIDPKDITNHIAKVLTEYMVPKVLVQIDSMPLTANGKVDKKALPAIGFENQKRDYVEPENDAEIFFCNTFKKILKLEKVGATDDFFSLGGTSLTASKIVMNAMSNGFNVVYADVFANPTPRQLAKLVSSPSEKEEVKEENKVENTNLVDKALSGNFFNISDSVETKMLGNVILTGTTGFLGIHVLRELVEKNIGRIFCLIRKGRFASSEERLKAMYYFYFETSIDDLIGSRITCLDTDITDPSSVEKLQDYDFDTVFNCAACVKHFANDDSIEKVNVEGVRNLVNLCKVKGKKLIQISTISVAGEGDNGVPSPESKITEGRLYFGQILDNKYILSKFKAEQLILKAVGEGLEAKILRAGNLMPRLSDGEFQINNETNGFMRRLLGYYALGCIPYSHLSMELEFSPIDETASAMVALSKTNKTFTVFHANNTHKVFISDVIRAMNNVDLKVDIVDENEFASRMKKLIDDPEKNQSVSGLIAYMSHQTSRYSLGYDNTFTAKILNRIGFSWHTVDSSYIEKSLKTLKELGFFGFSL